MRSMYLPKIIVPGLKVMLQKLFPDAESFVSVFGCTREQDTLSAAIVKE